MKAVVLTRVSTEKQEEYSPELQRERCVKFCEAKGWEVVDVIQEQISGRKDIDKRSLKRILSRKDWDVLVVYKIDRLARRARIIHEVLETIEQQGRKFASVNESVDTTTAMGWGFLAMTAAFAEIESRVIGERAVFGHAASKSKGYKTMRYLSPWLEVRDEDGKRVLYPKAEALDQLARPHGLTASQARRLRALVARWQAARDAGSPWILAPKRP
jgi:DNA invertase Pin-like site-specific DNA recombinase